MGGRGGGNNQPKYIIGDYKGDSDPRLSLVHWNDLTGGWGIDRITEEKDLRHVRFGLSREAGHAAACSMIIIFLVAAARQCTFSFL